MIEIQDFIAERGGDPEKIKESQRRRHAPVEIVDEIAALWEDHRKSMATNYGRCETTILTPPKHSTKRHK